MAETRESNVQPRSSGDSRDEAFSEVALVLPGVNAHQRRPACYHVRSRAGYSGNSPAEQTIPLSDSPSHVFPAAR